MENKSELNIISYFVWIISYSFGLAKVKNKKSKEVGEFRGEIREVFQTIHQIEGDRDLKI